MPKYNGIPFERLSAIQAYRKGYLSSTAYYTHLHWVRQDLENRRFKLFVYINGEYKGMSLPSESIFELVERFIIFFSNTS